MIGAAAPGVAAAYDPNAAAAMYGRGSAPGNDDYCYNACMLQLILETAKVMVFSLIAQKLD